MSDQKRIICGSVSLRRRSSWPKLRACLRKHDVVRQLTLTSPPIDILCYVFYEVTYQLTFLREFSVLAFQGAMSPCEFFFVFPHNQELRGRFPSVLHLYVSGAVHVFSLHISDPRSRPCCARTLPREFSVLAFQGAMSPCEFFFVSPHNQELRGRFPSVLHLYVSGAVHAFSLHISDPPL